MSNLTPEQRDELADVPPLDTTRQPDPDGGVDLTDAEFEAFLSAAKGDPPTGVHDPCPTCGGPSRETVGMVCQTCGTDYGTTPDDHDTQVRTEERERIAKAIESNDDGSWIRHMYYAQARYDAARIARGGDR